MKRKIKTKRNKTKRGGASNNGFTETLLPKQKLTKQNQQSKNSNLCKSIFTLGKNTTKKNFIPSQFPKLTGLSQIYSQKIKKEEEEKLKKKEEEELKAKEKEEIIQKARKDVAELKEAARKQEIYEKAVIEANKQNN